MSAFATHQIPEALAQSLADAGLRDVLQWWKDLDLISRRQVCQLWADCVAAHAGQTIEAHVEGRLVEENEEPTSDTIWHNDFYEYLINHEEIYFEERIFHVCTRHPKIKEALQKGVIPTGFSCGLDAAACPARQMLDWTAGRAVRLRIAFRPIG